jgi:hypothetical protein
MSVRDLAVSPAVVKAAEAAWARYATACRMGGTPDERAASYLLARQAEQHLWRAENRDAANCDTGA